ncbi:MAG: hypothetical protein HYZ69_01380 [Candidatus Colwellbacteria bacterium]|nr:hypothetical protein [Candidatus Colwellbacteria bacterium]
MAKKMDVTIPQAMSLRAMATDKGVGRVRFQTAMDNGQASLFLDAVKDGRKITLLPEFVAPEGGRIHELTIPVVLDEEWQAAITAGGPDTPDNYNVRKVGDQYRPSGKGTKKSRMILVNFGPNGGSWDRAIAWAAQYPQLKRSAPRQVFAISKHKPDLHRELGFNPMYVVATTECTFEGTRRACSAWWGGAEREARLYWVSDFTDADGWFAFFCE